MTGYESIIVNIFNYFIVLLAILIITYLHEAGHFYTARLFKVKIKTFACGFGPKMMSFYDQYGVEWKFSIIPLGGYVEFADQLITDHDKQKLKLFDSIHPAKRFLIAFAGPLMNFILAYCFFRIVYMMSVSCDSPLSMCINSINNTFSSLFSKNVHNNMRSVISIFHMFKSDGLLSILKFIARLSLGVGFINLLPFLFVLDGGQMLICVYDMIFGLKERSSLVIQKIAHVQMYLLFFASMLLIMRDIFILIK